MKHPIIFLNIDGVLISEEYIYNNCSDINNFYRKIDNNYYINFEYDKIEKIKNLVNSTNAYIVIVSYWCYNNDIKRMKEIFNKYDLDDKIIDIVPFSTVRSGVRVDKWLNNNKSSFNLLDKDNFIIIDNDDTSLYKERHVKCDSKIGLTDIDKKKAKKLIKKQK